MHEIEKYIIFTINGYFIECITANLKHRELSSRYGFGKFLVHINIFIKRNWKLWRFIYICNKKYLWNERTFNEKNPSNIVFFGTFNNTVKTHQFYWSPFFPGWESQILETGFLATFLCPVWNLHPIPEDTPTSKIVIWGFRWLIFRIMIGAVSLYYS